ncbi:TonB family protein [Salinisphaera dokdonensis CL-ES53]|uniref:TonB family protein n=1 Tax=Salinisphaera dokdonensis CL-ES53 TaxID=1304272 RepID=A0ABV2AX05_9GAMM
MSSARARFCFCLAIALIAHALLLGWSSDNTEPAGSDALAATRAAGAPAAQQDTSVRAIQHQRGDDSFSQNAVAARQPVAAQAPVEASRPGQKTLTRFVMVTERSSEASEQEQPSTQAAVDTPQSAQAQRVLSAAQDARAEYLAAWQQRIETRGSRRYSRQLLEANKPRRLTMAVRVGADGRLREVRVLRSSGNKALDAAALAIVRSAAPYDPFDVALTRMTSELSFAYDWLFEPGGASELSPSG